MSDNIHYLEERFKDAGKPPKPPKGGGGGGDEGGESMEKRVEKLEQTSTDIQIRMVRIETRLESIESNMANHTDVANIKNDLAGLELRLIKWFVATAFAMTGLAASISFGLARLLQ